MFIRLIGSRDRDLVENSKRSLLAHATELLTANHHLPSINFEEGLRIRGKPAPYELVSNEPDQPGLNRLLLTMVSKP